MMPLVKKRWKNGYTNSIGMTTTIVTVMRTDVAVCALARLAAMDAVELVLLIKALSELA